MVNSFPGLKCGNLIARILLRAPGMSSPNCQFGPYLFVIVLLLRRTHVNQQRMLIIKPVNRLKIDVGNWEMTVFDERFEFSELQIVFDGVGEPKLARGIYGPHRFCSEDRAIAHFTKFWFSQAQTETGKRHAHAGRDTGIFQLLAIEGGFDGIAMLFVKRSGRAQHLFARRG